MSFYLFYLFAEHEHFSQLSLKQLRRDIERHCRIDCGLDIVPSGVLAGIVEDFSSIASRARAVDSGGFLHGKFSRQETETMLRYTRDFVAANGLQLADVCYCLRDPEDTGRSTKKTLWSELAILLPHRRKEVIDCSYN